MAEMSSQALRSSCKAVPGSRTCPALAGAHISVTKSCREGTCGGLKRKGLAPVAPSEPLQGDGVRSVGLEAGDIDRAQCPRHGDIAALLGAASLLHLQHKALKGPVCCCPGELETIPAGL